jgi:hypothetical protein
MSPEPNERGAALVAVLCLTTVLLPLGAYVVVQSRSDFLIQRNVQGEVEALYVAEAGLEQALAEIRPGNSFDDVLVGPDGIGGTADDGTFPFASEPSFGLTSDSFRYHVRVVRDRSDLIRIISRGSGTRGSTKVVEALVKRSPMPTTPAALYAEGDASGTDLGPDFRISGLDHEPTPPLRRAAGNSAPVPAIGTSREAAIPRLRERFAGQASPQTEGAGGAPSIGASAALGLDSYVARLGAAARVVNLPSSQVDELQLGTMESPQLSVIAGDLDVSGQLRGAGILIVRGTLHVSGQVEFSGLLLVEGGLRSESTSRVTLLGSVWRTAADERLTLHGEGVIAYSQAALTAVDRAFPGLLPHAASVVGWREQL